MQARSQKTIVIGAGPAGLTAAYKLAQAGHHVHVLEASPYVGGLSRSLELWGQTVDLGPHRFFSSDKIVNDHWHEIIGQNYTMVDRLTRIYYRDRFFFYPLQPLNALRNLGALDVIRCLVSYIFVKLAPRKDAATFEAWVTSRFGERLFQIFFKTYTEKVWGIPCSRIDADWAAQRIKKLSLFEAVKAAFFKDRKQTHKTLVDQFAYPHGGTGQLYETMATKIAAMGGQISLNKPIVKILVESHGSGLIAKGVKCQDGEEMYADHVISTMPLTLMAKSIEQAPQSVREACDRLYYRNTILAYLEIDATDLFPDNWIYVHSPQVKHGRITNFRNWCPSLTRGKNTSIICLEFWCFDEDKIWGDPESEIGALAEKELRSLRLLPAGVRCLNRKIIKIPRSYPVYETGYAKVLGVVQSFVDSVEKLYAIGRYGAFKYNNQDHSILMGLLAAREIATGQKQNLWAINTDSEYQEKAEIKGVGLAAGLESTNPQFGEAELVGPSSKSSREKVG